MAAVSVAIMFVGAFILPNASIGLILIGAGVLAVAVLIVSASSTGNGS
jgi:hypothetical protein